MPWNPVLPLGKKLVKIVIKAPPAVYTLLFCSCLHLWGHILAYTFPLQSITQQGFLSRRDLVEIKQVDDGQYFTNEEHAQRLIARMAFRRLSRRMVRTILVVVTKGTVLDVPKHWSPPSSHAAWSHPYEYLSFESSVWLIRCSMKALRTGYPEDCPGIYHKRCVRHLSGPSPKSHVSNQPLRILLIGKM